MQDVSDEKDREEIKCPKCGYTMGWFGNLSDCYMVCPRCKQTMELTTTNEEFCVRGKRKTAKKAMPQKPEPFIS